MAASQKDSNPNVGGKAAKGMKNNDGREMGSAYDTQHPASANFKNTPTPNDGAPQLPQVSGVLQD